MNQTNNDSVLINSWRKSPIAFIKDIWDLRPQPLKPEYLEVSKRVPLRDFKKEWFKPFIKGKHITWQQWVMLLAVEKSLKYAAPKRISVKSGHGVGKDAFLSWIILWYLLCFKDSQIPCTAPTSEQIHDILWKEIAIWLNRMPKYYKAVYDWSAGYIRIKDSPETWFARARTARKENPEALAGIHGDFVMIVVDESSGVPNEIFKPAEGALTNENILVILIGNPVRNIGYFYDTHHSDKQNWQDLTFSSEDSPIVEYGYCERIIDKFGIDSDEYRYMVKGLFPKEDTIDDKGYVPLLIQADLRYTTDEKFVGRIRLGIDPSGEGSNKTSWVARDNFKAKVLANEAISNGKGIAQKTITLLDFLGISKKQAKKDCIIDGFGIGVDAVKELALAGYDINVINTGDQPYKGKPDNEKTDEDKQDESLFINKRAMSADRGKNWLRSGGEIVRGGDLDKQLLQIKYTRILSGKKKIMSKEDMRKSGIQSPDDADAFFLTFIEREEPEETYKKFKQKDWDSGSTYIK